MRIFWALAAVLLIGSGYYYYQHKLAPGDLELLYPPPYVAIYGRETCGYTREYQSEVARLGMRYYSKSVDDLATAAVLHERMYKAGLRVRQYGLPVLDVNGQIFIRPSMDQVTAAYSTQPSGAQKSPSWLDRFKKVRPTSGAQCPVGKGRPVQRKEGGLRLEGIVLGDPPAAMINGEMVQKNGVISGHTVVDVGADFVKLKDPRGREITKTLR